jgi:hypothetical protein
MTGLGRPLFVARIVSVKGAPESVVHGLAGFAWSASTSQLARRNT